MGEKPITTLFINLTEDESDGTSTGGFNIDFDEEMQEEYIELQPVLKQLKAAKKYCNVTSETHHSYFVGVAERF
ncbi:hypothetical protein V5739_15790 [Salinimicrobium sp. TIG7-5_MAKvit]|uniref:hypothetical protein n=1 Tax=Salinimicrobium sp. TIG7-5_MAKvit TaxID=3121289 RepID=UPI003C6E47D5